MKNFKRTLALVLAVIMVVGMFASVSAAKAKWYANAVRYIESVGIATIGSTAEDKITRDEFVLWVAKLESGTLNDKYWSSAMETPFTDITEDHNQTAIWYAARRSLIEGNGDGTFAPDKNITFAEAAAVIVRLMRYTSKVEGDADDWQWAYMEVANEYCEAFNNEFLDNVGGSVYDYDYELTKGEAAYLLATIMNAPNEIIKGQIDTSNPYKTTYKSLTIDGMNLGERFYERWNGGVGSNATSNTYYVYGITFDFDNGTVQKVGLDDEDVILAPVNATKNSTLKLSAAEFTSLVRVDLGLPEKKAEDEDEINVRNTVKLGTLLDVIVDEDGDVISIDIHEGSKVVDTHILMDSMIGGIADWTADTVVTGASNSNEYREAIMNGTWSSDLLYTWAFNSAKTKATLTFEGQKYVFNNATNDKETEDTADDTTYVKGDLDVISAMGTGSWSRQFTNVKSRELNVEQLVAMIPDVATGEVTLIFNDYDLDGKYDAVVIAESALNFETRFYDNVTINNKYYSDGYSVDTKTASGKLNLVVLANGRYGMGVSGFDSDADGKLNEELTAAEIDELARTNTEWFNANKAYIYLNSTSGKYEIYEAGIEATDKDFTPANFPGLFKDIGNEMNAYQVIDLATISSGVIVESTLRTFSTGEKYFVVKVQNAAGAAETVYLPYTLTDVKAPKFDYTINGVTKKFDTATAGWVVADKLAFVEEAKTLTGIKNDADAGSFADNATKLVGQYISYIVQNGVAVYCVAGAPSGDNGYLLNVEETDVANMYNVTIANVANGAVSDVKIYSVNATASTMMGKNYEKISSIFNKGNIHNTPVDLGANNSWIGSAIGTDGKTVVLEDYISENAIDALIPVTVHSNGTFSYISIDETPVDIDFTQYTTDELLSTKPVVVVDEDGDAVTEIKYYKNGVEIDVDDIDVDAKGNLYLPVEATTTAGTAGSEYSAKRTYAGEFYSKPQYMYDDANDKWILCVDTNTVTMTYTFGVDSTSVTKANYKELSDSALVAVLTKAIDTYKTNWINVTINAAGTKVLSYANYDGTAKDDTYGAATNGQYVVPAEIRFDADNKMYVAYDFRGVDRTYYVSIANKVEYYTDADGEKVYNGTKTNNAGWYTLTGTAKVDSSVYTADMTTAITAKGAFATNTEKTVTKSWSGKTAVATWTRTVIDAQSSVANVAFTAMDKTETGYIPGSYWFTLADSETLYFNGGTAADEAGLEVSANVNVDYDTYKALKNNGYSVSTSSIKFRTTVNTEVVLLTPTATGYVVNVMTPAEAAAKDLIITHYSFVVPEQLNAAMDATPKTAKTYDNYNNKLEAIVLVGQEALVATTPEVDDGKTVHEGEYLVSVPSDAETILVAPEGSKTVKVASTKSVYAIPSGKEIGAIYYEYDVYSGAEQPTIKTEIAAGWYIVNENGEILEVLGDITKTADKTNKYNGVYVNDAVVTVEDGKVVATVYVQDKNYKNTSTVLATYDLETEATLLYRDVDGTLKVVADKDAQFASSSIYNLTVANAYTAVETAYKAYVKAASNNWSIKAEKLAAYEAAVAAYNEALAANIDKFFNGDIWDSFKATVAKETNIQGAGEYTVDVYNVDGEVFVILNNWTSAEVDAYGVATVSSNLK